MASEHWKKFTCECCSQHFKEFTNVICSRSFFVMIGIGQALSLLICGTAVTSGLLQNESVAIPTGQTFFTYVLLSATFTSWMCWATGVKSIPSLLKDRGWKYFFLALIDVEANYLVIKAYQFTSVTSVQLLDCLAIPTVLILSWRLIGVRYRWSHLVGVVGCLLGASILVLADHLTEKNGQEESSNSLLGDLLVVGGAILYGISNVSQEILVSRYGTVEYLGSYSFFATLISGTQFAILERQDFVSINFCSRVVWPLLGFVICLFLFSMLMSYAMLKIGAMAVNLNLLSSDFFALLVGLFIFQYKFHVLYFVSFILIICGIIIYNLRPPFSKDISLAGTESDCEKNCKKTVDKSYSCDGPSQSVVMLDDVQNAKISDQESTFDDSNEIIVKYVCSVQDQEAVQQLKNVSEEDLESVTHL